MRSMLNTAKYRLCVGYAHAPITCATRVNDIACDKYLAAATQAAQATGRSMLLRRVWACPDGGAEPVELQVIAVSGQRAPARWQPHAATSMACLLMAGLPCRLPADWWLLVHTRLRVS